MIKNITLRQWAVFFAVSSAVIVGSALVSQYGFGMHPCKLCITQRWPYAIAIALSFVLFFMNHKKHAAMLLLGLLFGVFAFETGLALFHMGVEYKWWTFNSDCVAGAIQPHATVDQMLAALRKAPLVRCDDRVPFLFGMTMAFYNMVLSAILAGLALVATWCAYQRSSSLSQYR
jgi:disulfide bond formation protein DsbB